MDLDIEYNIHKILSGFYCLSIDNNSYKILSPDLQLQQRAHSFYLDILEDNKYNTQDWIASDTIDLWLRQNGLWNEYYQHQLDLLYKEIDQIKIQLYLEYSNNKNREDIKKTLTSQQTQISVLYQQKNYFDHTTLENYASLLKNQFLIANSTYHLDGSQVFDNNWYNIDLSLFTKIVSEVYSHTLTMGQLNYISRQNMWRSYWNIAKEKLFNSSAMLWTSEQIAIINICKTLDNITEHPEAPTAEIMNDQDALDGWILYQNEKNNKAKKIASIEEKYGLHKSTHSGAGEVFILTDDSVEANAEIYNLNTKVDNIKIKNNRKYAIEHGQTQWIDLPDVKQDVLNELRKK